MSFWKRIRCFEAQLKIFDIKFPKYVVHISSLKNKVIEKKCHFMEHFIFLNFLKIIIIPNELTRMLQELSEEIF